MRGLILGVAVLAAACGGSSAGRSENVTVGMKTDFQPINPITAGDQYTVELINYGLFTPLIQYDDALRPTPYLAESWDMSDTAVTFHLRHDVKWHDGQPVTAEDVKFTFDMAKDPATGSLIGSVYVPNVKSAVVVDSFTVHFTFSKPHAQAIEDFWWAPAPKHLLKNITADQMRNADYNRAPVGSGPFRFSKWIANQRLIVTRNPAYPQSLGGPATVQRVVLRIIPEASTMQTELVTGGVQVDVPVTPDQIRQIKRTRSVRFIGFPGKSLYYLGFNNKREPFKSANVRRALSMAIDRQEIIDALLFGEAAIATSTVPPWHPLYPKGVPMPVHDVAGAKRLLEQEGWRDSNNDGIRDKNGQPLKFTILSSDASMNRSIVEVIQSQLRKVGVDAKVRPLEFQTLLTQHKARDFDAVFSSWVLDNFQMASAPGALFHSSLANVPKSTNRSGVSIPELDRLIDKASAAVDDSAAIPVWRELTEVLQREQPVALLFWLNELAATSNDIVNVKMDPRGELLTMRSWAVKR